MEAVNFVFRLELLVSENHFFGVRGFVRLQLNLFQVHHCRFEVELSISHEGEHGLVFPITGHRGGDVVTLRDLGNVVPLVAERLVCFGHIRLQKSSVDEAVAVLESTHEDVLLLSVTLDGDNGRSHASCGHLSDLSTGFKLHVLVEL